MTNCDFSERPARDVIIVSDKDRNRGCKKKDKDHLEFLCELYEAQAAQGRYIVHELTQEASSRMKCMGKIMATPGTRAAAADLCMFGLAACDTGGPGLVNASVRTINQRATSRSTVAKQAHWHTSACPSRRRRHNRKEGAKGNMGAASRQSSRGTTEEG